MTDKNLWSRRGRERHADLYDAEYAKQLERIARIRNEVSAGLDGAESDVEADEARVGEPAADDPRPGRAGKAVRGAPRGDDPRLILPGEVVGGTARGDDARPVLPGEVARGRDARAGRAGEAASGGDDPRPGRAGKAVRGATRGDAAPPALAGGGPDRARGGKPHAPAPPAAGRWDAAPVDFQPAPRATARPVPRRGTARCASAPVAAGPARPRRRPSVASTPPARRRLRSRGLVAAAALAVLAGSGVAAFLAVRPPAAPAATIFTVPGQPTGLASDGGRVWVAGPMAGAVWILDAASGRPLAPPLKTGGTPARIALDARFAWIADTASGALVRAPLRPGPTRKPLPVGPDVSDVAIADGAVWTASSADGTIRVLDGKRRTTLHVGARPVALAADGRRVVAADAAGALIRLDARARRPEGEPVPLGGTPVDVALAGDFAWLVDARAGTVQVVEVGSGVAGAPMKVCRVPVAIEADATGAYVLCRGDRTLARIDQSGAVSTELRLRHAPTALALDPRHVWIAAGEHEVIRVDR